METDMASVIFCVDKTFQYSCIVLLNCPGMLRDIDRLAHVHISLSSCMLLRNAFCEFLLKCCKNRSETSSRKKILGARRPWILLLAVSVICPVKTAFHWGQLFQNEIIHEINQ